MTRRLTALLVLMVVLPTGLLTWLAIRGIRDERTRVAGQLEAAALSRLADVDERLKRVLEDRSRQLLELMSTSDADSEMWRRIVRTHPEVAQIAVQDADGRLVHPPLELGISDAERHFLIRIRQVLQERLSTGEPELQTPNLDSSQRLRPADDHGWVAWYWDTGLHLLFWRRDPTGGVVAVELDRTRLVSDLLVELSTADEPAYPSVGWGRVVLEDSQGRVLYQSGAEPAEGHGAESVERRLSPPLGAWSLRAEVSDGSLGTLGSWLRVVALFLVAAVFGGLAFVFHRESTRELREASERVGFVNQVSHELRTPLTNIRLYAELLERRLADDDENTPYLEIIIAESGRLSRLIGNVLSFARREREALVIHPFEASVDDTLRAVADQFRPSLEGKGMEISLSLAASRPVIFDPDAVEQVVGNLLSNVEKYAADGGVVEIASRQTGETTFVQVVDRGPGIPAGREEAVFEPFVRLSDRLTEGVSGTGIGLSIARELARLHGGELRLVPTDEGACFELELPDDRSEGST